MAFNTNMFALAPREQIESPQNSLAKVLQLQQAQQTGELNTMKLDAERRGESERVTLADLYRGATSADGKIDRGNLLTGAAQRGLGAQIPGLQKGFNDQDKSAREAEKATLEGHLKKFELAGQIMSGVSDQASWDGARQQTIEVFGAEAAAKMPAVYDPALVEQNRMKAMTVKDQLEQKHKALTFGETQRHNQSTEGLTAQGQQITREGQQITLRGQNMADGRARESLAQSNTNSIRSDERAREFNNTRVEENKIKREANKGEFAKLTEDQGKATGWLVQADNAYKNMMAVGVDAKGAPTSAARPGFNDALAAIPSFGLTGGIANTMRGADRQKFMQATSSLSESLLRAATGAGVNRDEAEQKIKELTPQFGEDSETTKQKYAAIPLYIESLKVRAGPGASRAGGITANAGGVPKAINFGDLK